MVVASLAASVVRKAWCAAPASRITDFVSVGPETPATSTNGAAEWVKTVRSTGASNSSPWACELDNPLVLATEWERLAELFGPDAEPMARLGYGASKRRAVRSPRKEHAESQCRGLKIENEDRLASLPR
jgi:hypothetical protein